MTTSALEVAVTPESYPRLRVLHVLESFGAGVFEMMKALVTNQSSDAGYDVHVAYCANRAETPSGWRKLFPGAVSFHEVRMERDIRPAKDLASAVRLGALLRTLRPDVVHLHSSKAGAIGRVACLFTGQKGVVYTPHGLSFLRQDVGRGMAMTLRMAERMLAYIPGSIVAVSPSERRELELIASPSCIRLIENGVDEQLLLRVARDATRQAPGKAPVVGMAGRLTAQKGPRLFADVVKAIMRTRADVSFLWIGDGPERRVFEADPLLAENIRVTGWLEREEALRELAALDVYLHTSLWEGLPVTMLEAMALSRPVVTTSAVGNRDLVTDGVTGRIGMSVEELATAVLSLLDDRSSGRALAHAGHRLVKDRYTVQRMTASYRELYLRVAGKGPV